MAGKSKVEVVLLAPSHNAEAGTKVKVSAEKADSLVARGLARKVEK